MRRVWSSADARDQKQRYSIVFSMAFGLAPILLPSWHRCSPQDQMPRSRRKSESLSTLQDAELMAVVLEGRHGAFAAEVADFFALLHRQLGDASRAKAWGGVARTVRRREYGRLQAA